MPILIQIAKTRPVDEAAPTSNQLRPVWETGMRNSLRLESPPFFATACTNAALTPLSPSLAVQFVVR